MLKFSPLFLGTLVSTSILFNSCKEKPVSQAKQNDEPQEKIPKWSIPSPAPTGSEMVINQKVHFNTVNWLTPKSNQSSQLNIYVFWKKGSPLANLTFKKIHDLKLGEETSVQFISHQAPRFELRTSSLNKEFRFATDPDNKLAEKLKITTYPQIYITTKQGVVCWQGHPDHLSQETLASLLAKLGE